MSLPEIENDLTPRQREVHDACDRYAREALEAINGFPARIQQDAPVHCIRMAMLAFGIWYAESVIALSKKAE